MNIYYLIFYIVLVILAGIGAYLKLIPSDLFVAGLTFVFGHLSGLFLPAPGATPPAPTSTRPITSNAYISPEVRRNLPAGGNAPVQPPTGGNPAYPGEEPK